MDDYLALQAKLNALRNIFRPSAPTDTLELFRGRIRQLQSAQAGLSGIGEHIVIYGERGVGKTSLAYITQMLFDRSHGDMGLSVRVQCTDGASFTEVWQEFYARLMTAVAAKGKAFRDYLKEELDQIDEIVNFPNGDLGATEINRALSLLTAKCELLLVFDEFDRLGGWDETTPFGDLIKGLSDDRLSVTLLIVGVADNIDGLVKSHRSTSRNLRQIAMPRMEPDELVAISEKGIAAYAETTGESLVIGKKAAEFIAHIAQGFPYYVHLLCGAAASDAIVNGSEEVTTANVLDSMITSAEEADHAVRISYVTAITGRVDANLDATLLACALARVDDLGFFSSTQVATALSDLTGTKKGTGHVNAHLKKFSESPCWVLERNEISERKIRYRFTNPIMKPFVLIKGYQSGKLGTVVRG